MEEVHEVKLDLTLRYSGKEQEPEAIRDIVESALDHCRQEGMLTDPEWEETSCDGFTCTIAEDDE